MAKNIEVEKSTQVLKPSLEDQWLVWQKCLEGNDQNSIFRQIYRMVWDTAMIKFIIECWKASTEKTPDRPRINGYFHDFILRCYFSTSSTAIRRLTDSYGLAGSKGVYSLCSILDDIKSFQKSLTREKYFQLRELIYDTGDLERMENEYIHEHLIDEESSLSIPLEIDPQPSHEAHQLFDRLSGKNEENRSSFDTIHERVFTVLQSKLGECELVRKYVDKFVAHSATPESREEFQIDNEQITIGKIWDAQRSLYEVAQFLAWMLSSTDRPPLMVLPRHAFDHWDAPLIETTDISRLKEVYNKYLDETEQWRLESTGRIWDRICLE